MFIIIIKYSFLALLSYFLISEHATFFFGSMHFLMALVVGSVFLSHWVHSGYISTSLNGAGSTGRGVPDERALHRQPGQRSSIEWLLLFLSPCTLCSLRSVGIDLTTDGRTSSLPKVMRNHCIVREQVSYPWEKFSPGRYRRMKLMAFNNDDGFFEVP